MKLLSIGYRTSLFCLGLGGTLLGFGQARAEVPCEAQQQVLQQNREGMGAYDNLDVEGALRRLREAAALEESCVSPQVRARTFMNLGVVLVGGFMNNAEGIEAFRRAICLDASAQLDPVTSNEDIQTAFRLAFAQYERQGCPGGGRGERDAGNNGTSEETGGSGGRPRFELYRHRQISEQERMHPVPYYIEVNPAVQVGQVRLHYRVAGESNFTLVDLETVGANAYAGMVPCDTIALFDPAWVEYFIEILNPEGARIGTAPDEGGAQPYRTVMVPHLTGEVPSIPGRQPPEACVNCGDLPPGAPIPPECQNRPGAGETCGDRGMRCSTDDDCITGECTNGCCQRSRRDSRFVGQYRPYFFLQLGFGWGGGYILASDQPEEGDDGSTMPKRAMYQNVPSEDQPQCSIPDDPSLGGPFASPQGEESGKAWGVNGCWFRTTGAGFAPGAGHLRLYVGGYLLPMLDAGLLFRYQFDGFKSDAHYLWSVGARIRYHIFQLDNMEFSVGLHGQFYGSQQVFLKSKAEYGGRVWSHGGYQSIGLNVGYAYYFFKRFGLFVEVASDWTWPQFIWNVEASAGPALRI